jgi:hypothetical protein
LTTKLTSLAIELGLLAAKECSLVTNKHSLVMELSSLEANKPNLMTNKTNKVMEKHSLEANKTFLVTELVLLVTKNLAAGHDGSDETTKKIIEISASSRDLMVKAGEITREEIVEAQRLSSEFVPKKETHNSIS